MICFQTSARVYKIGLAKRLVEASWKPRGSLVELLRRDPSKV